MTLGLTLAVAAGCAAPGPPAVPVAGEPAAPHLVWHTQLTGDVLEVQITDPGAYYRVDTVRLISPAGAAYEAFETTRETVDDQVMPYGGGVGVGIGGGYGSRSGGSVGVGLSFPLGGSDVGPVVRRTTARIRLPGGLSPADEADLWRIELGLTDPAGRRSVARFPGPRPPD